jgi:cysteine-rich repeat protein
MHAQLKLAANTKAGENCDGNAVSGDGCSATCQVEANYTCDGGSPTVCTHN